MARQRRSPRQKCDGPFLVRGPWSGIEFMPGIPDETRQSDHLVGQIRIPKVSNPVILSWAKKSNALLRLCLLTQPPTPTGSRCLLQRSICCHCVRTRLPSRHVPFSSHGVGTSAREGWPRVGGDIEVIRATLLLLFMQRSG